MGYRGLSGQSAIEYLMTYGWMLLVVAVTGGAIFATVGDQGVESTSGFDGDIAIDNFGVSDQDELGLEVRDGSEQGITISKVNVSDPDTDQWIYKEFTGENRVGVGSSKIFELPNVSRTDSNNELNVEIVYDTGGLSNLSVSGTVSGFLDLTDSGSYEGPPEDNHQEIRSQEDFEYFNFSRYSKGSFPSDSDWSFQFSDNNGDNDWNISNGSDLTADQSVFDNITGGKVLASEPTDFNNDNQIVWNGQEGRNVEILMLQYHSSRNTYLILRSNGSQSSERTGYIWTWNDGWTEWIRRYENDGYNSVEYGENTSIPFDQWYWIRFRAGEDEIKGKFWEKGAQEPDEWNWSRSYQSTQLNKGEVGMSHEDHHEWYIDELYIKFNGSGESKWISK
ncbi:MAG: hypothetical protein R6V35_01930 [Candidatus Nanohaloarchaea archaeon]